MLNIVLAFGAGVAVGVIFHVVIRKWIDDRKAAIKDALHKG